MNVDAISMYRIKTTIMYTFITMLVLSTSLACMNSEEEKQVFDAPTISQPVAEEDQMIVTPTFKTYGELVPVNYLNGGEDSLTLPYGFLVERVAGCEITPELVQSVKENNEAANKQMIAIYGETWIADFEKETGVKISIPSL